MAKLIVDLNKGEVTVTKYQSKSGYSIPDNISQESKYIAIIEKNLDEDPEEEVIPQDKRSVTRLQFLRKLLSFSQEAPKIIDNYHIYGKGLYSDRDLQKPITWAEVSYLIYYVFGAERVLDWTKVKPEGFKVCVLFEVGDEGSGKIVDEKISHYKNRLDMESYIKMLKNQERFIPVPLYCSFMDLVANPDTGVTLNKNEIFKRISETEFIGLF